jgi:hypothetical protein
MLMKNVEIDPAIQANPALLALVHRANELLELELGRSSHQVSASWRLEHNEQGRIFLRLEIWDWTGRVGTNFAPDDLRSDPLTQGRLIRLWGNLLQIRSHKLLDEIQAGAAGAEGT